MARVSPSADPPVASSPYTFAMARTSPTPFIDGNSKRSTSGRLMLDMFVATAFGFVNARAVMLRGLSIANRSRVGI